MGDAVFTIIRIGDGLRLEESYPLQEQSMTKRHKGLGQRSTQTEAELGSGYHGQQHWTLVKMLHFPRSLLSNSTVRLHNFLKNRHCTGLQGCDLQVTQDGNMSLEDTDLRKQGQGKGGWEWQWEQLAEV